MVPPLLLLVLLLELLLLLLLLLLLVLLLELLLLLLLLLLLPATEQFTVATILSIYICFTFWPTCNQNMTASFQTLPE